MYFDVLFFIFKLFGDNLESFVYNLRDFFNNFLRNLINMYIGNLYFFLLPVKLTLDHGFLSHHG